MDRNEATLTTADRDKKVAVIEAEKEADAVLVKNVKPAEATKKAAELKANQARPSL